MRVSRSLALVIGLAASLSASVALAQDSAGDVATFRQLRAEGLAAARDDDLVTASARLAEADRLIPNHPGIMVLRARLAVAMGDPAEALVHYGRYARAGLVMDFGRDEAFSTLRETPAHADSAAAVVAQVEANRQPVGETRLGLAFSIEGGALAESLVRDTAGRRWLVSQIAGRTIVSVADDGTVSPWLRPHPAVSGVVGLALDPDRRVLWAATSPLPPAAHDRDGPAEVSALLKIELATAEVIGVYPAPDDGREHALGDLVLGPDGMVYVADGAAGDVYRLDAGTGALVPFVSGVFGSPQGMVVWGDQLFVADYSSGLWRVPLDASGEALRLSAPAEASLIGIDGLVGDGAHLYAIQNGVAPQRVLRLTLSDDRMRITDVTVLAANLAEIDEPTTGVILEGDLVFVSRSQWGSFNAEGAPASTEMDPALVSRLALEQESDE